jgi:hypothetical protein
MSDYSASDFLGAALKLHAHITKNHLCEDGAVVGPDAGARWELRLWRFVKSYSPWLKWKDVSKYLLQSQGYWILDNLVLFNKTNDESFLRAAVRCADVIISKQTDQGYWLYDSPEWRDRVTTVEGSFATLGLLAAYRAVNDKRYLDAANRWWQFLMSEIGFQDYDSESKSLSYWAFRESGMVPNNSTLGLWLAAELADITKDKSYLDCCPQMINFLRKCQLPSGEFPYVLYPDQHKSKTHYLCYEYHAFQFLDLTEYYALTKDERVHSIMQRVASFLAGGVRKNGESKCDCFKEKPGVIYYTAAVASALHEAERLGFGDYSELSDRAYRRVIDHQKDDGSFIYSYGNYGFLTDKRSYPRLQSMILKHLLMRAHED